MLISYLKYTILALLIPYVSATLRAQDGSSAYSFLEITSSAKAFALGGVNISTIDDDLNLADQNPGLLGPEIDIQLALNYMHYFGDSNFAGARFGMAAGERGAWSAGLQYLGYGSMTSTDISGQPTGSFSVKDIVISGIYSHDFTDRLRGGINFKMISSTYEQYSAFAMAADIGINYYNEERDLSLSAVLKNMGGQLKRFDSAYDRLPFDIQLGYTQGLGSSPFILSITAWHLNKWSLPYYTHKDEDGIDTQIIKDSFVSNLFRHLVFGLQYSPSDKFYIGVGYNNKTRTDMSTYSRNFLSGFSAGLGFRLKSISLGLAYAQPHKGGASIMLNLSTNIHELLRR